MSPYLANSSAGLFWRLADTTKAPSAQAQRRSYCCGSCQNERRGDKKGSSKEKSMWGESMVVMIFSRLPWLFNYCGEEEEVCCTGYVLTWQDNRHLKGWQVDWCCERLEGMPCL